MENLGVKKDEAAKNIIKKIKSRKFTESKAGNNLIKKAKKLKRIINIIR